jgi:hypothetical protein
MLDESVSMDPILWRIGAIELVVATGMPYRYDTVAQHALQAPVQRALF